MKQIKEKEKCICLYFLFVLTKKKQCKKYRVAEGHGGAKV